MELLKGRAGIESKFFELCQTVTESNGYELYDLEYLSGPKLLRLYIMNKSTQTAVIEDCIKVDNALSPFFESETWMPEEVTLEVSSPGIYRVFRTLNHFQMAVGKLISIIITKNLNGEAFVGMPKSITAEKKLRGSLLSVTEEGIILEIGKFKVPVQFENIKRAHLDEEIDFKK
ncbi:MAG: ribosome maturation factor RimP [Bacteriovoracaceae bacterium]